MYAWLVTLHLVGFAVFLACHAVSMWVSFRVRRETNREVIGSLLDLSVRGSRAMYLGLLLLLVGGFGAGASAGLLLAPWMIASYVVLVVVFVLMSAVAGMFYHPLRAAIAGTDTVPRLDNEALVARLQNRRPELLAAIGVTGLLALIALMTVKPALW
jgi:hypothetical protein